MSVKTELSSVEGLLERVEKMYSTYMPGQDYATLYDCMEYFQEVRKDLQRQVNKVPVLLKGDGK